MEIAAADFGFSVQNQYEIPNLESEIYSAMKRYMRYALLGGDVFALLLFVAIGQRDHDLVNPENPIGGVLMTGAVFVIPWLVVAWLVGAYGSLGGANDAYRLPLSTLAQAVILRGLNAWLIAAPLAVLLRAIVFGRAVIPTSFLIVATGLGGAFVLGWRLLFLLVAWRQKRRKQQEKVALLS